MLQREQVELCTGDKSRKIFRRFDQPHRAWEPAQTSKDKERQIISDNPVFLDLTSPSSKFIVPDGTRGIVLDFDGTTLKLKWTEAWRQHSMRKIITDLYRETANDDGRLPKWQLNRLHHELYGLTEVNMCRGIANFLSQQTGKTFDADNVLQRFRDKVASKITSDSIGSADRTVPGLTPFLEQARSRGISRVACSNGDADLAKPLLKHQGLDKLIDLNNSLFAHQVDGLPPKPAPDMYLYIANRLNLKPSEILVFEDSSTGAIAAMKAGMKVCLQPSLPPGRLKMDLPQIRVAVLSDLDREIRKMGSSWMRNNAGLIAVLAPKMNWLQPTFQDPLTSATN
jgi:HAD superfamily hydrolase (TIGR01509 family)